jgi:BON domain-containing protein
MGHMPGKDESSYDRIVRRTVVDPDGSLRPSPEEEQAARHRAGPASEHRIHPLSTEERATLARVDAALQQDPTIDLSDVQIGIDHRELIITGSVPGPSTSARIEDVVRAVAGVDRVDNSLVIRGAH